MTRATSAHMAQRRPTLGVSILHERARKVGHVQPLAAVLHAQAHVHAVAPLLARLQPHVACEGGQGVAGARVCGVTGCRRNQG